MCCHSASASACLHRVQSAQGDMDSVLYVTDAADTEACTCQCAALFGCLTRPLGTAASAWGAVRRKAEAAAAVRRGQAGRRTEPGPARRRAQAGEITVPPKQSSSLFYISQRPYLVSGSLRDQLLYPHPPAAVWAAASGAERARFQHMPHAHLAPDALEERLCAALEAVELDYLLGRGSGWWQVQNWNETLSGGARARPRAARRPPGPAQWALSFPFFFKSSGRVTGIAEERGVWQLLLGACAAL